MVTATIGHIQSIAARIDKITGVTGDWNAELKNQGGDVQRTAKVLAISYYQVCKLYGKNPDNLSVLSIDDYQALYA
jgi:hypothetical protein